MVVTKMTAAMVFGSSVQAGVYCFYANEQVSHDTNHIVEVLRRTLLKLEESGPLPRWSYLQLDNASDNKSAQFLAFLAYLVERCSFEIRLYKTVLPKRCIQKQHYGSVV